MYGARPVCQCGHILRHNEACGRGLAIQVEVRERVASLKLPRWHDADLLWLLPTSKQQTVQVQSRSATRKPVPIIRARTETRLATTIRQNTLQHTEKQPARLVSCSCHGPRFHHGSPERYIISYLSSLLNVRCYVPSTVKNSRVGQVYGIERKLPIAYNEGRRLCH